jgi:hypothetical protein
MTDDEKHLIKFANDARIVKAGYKVCDWLPILETPQLRSLEDIKGRMAVMNALINVSFGAPTDYIKNWLQMHGLSKHLSADETQVLNTDVGKLTEIELNGLRWYLEGLWALMWATKMIEPLEAEQFVGDNQASMMPDLENGEDNQKIDVLNNLRPEIEIYTMLDYYYRLHWYCVDERMNGREAKLNEGVVFERRRALEWVYQRSANWDDVEMST